MWVKDIERLTKQLVAGDGKEACSRDLNFIILCLWLLDRALSLGVAMCHSIKCILAVFFKQLGKPCFNPDAF